MKKIIGKTLLVLISILFLFSLSYAGENKKPPTAIQTDKIPSKSAVQVPKCPDFEVKSAPLRKTKSNNSTDGIVSLDAQVCNVGTADYVPPILAPAYAIWQVYSPPADGNYELIGRWAVNHLAISACNRFTLLSQHTYRIPRLIEWGHGTPKPGTCQGELVFLLSIKKDSADDVNFSRNEDCNTTNNLTKEHVKFTVQCD